LVDYIIYIAVSSVVLVVGLIVWHFVHDWYKEKQWRKNNPDEHEWTRNPVKKDPGLK
jgi:uncharacterized membrane protein